ncbi:ribosomal-protein-alanine acetyltransferase [Enterococcus haemoperoxidus ATCC BAA-382]|uniref:Ribosomal-protein-alanine acetyltransferase n=1 Tax=Enterococcus haemoperoxidus ATCC BAA-382 TaxID=1158608 RepID=R2QWJ7_9ENTE|nr:ribosomal protein S18-alanine N-acetyltransferase [Enterococcus haemoperoxidus]EOH99748.1 ribosomal-protein-alanine acetyltransferase [Enterococcus haemoperoxidus ATCC BAA-382]EOT62510.1 ribosomal-protein-alanine acetyltransferase [Enterococcus haemoperoxidus ATCC BAA-382]
MLKKFNLFHSILGIFFKNRPYDEKTVEISDQEYFVRGITLDDIKDLLSIEREVYAGELPWTKTAFLVELQSSEPHLYLLIQKEGKTIGFIGCRIFGKDAHITNVAVSSQNQGKGIGSFLIREVRQFAKNNDCETISLEVRISNKNAQRVYRQLGFVSNTIKPDYYTEDKEDALEMILYLKEE